MDGAEEATAVRGIESALADMRAAHRDAERLERQGADAGEALARFDRAERDHRLAVAFGGGGRGASEGGIPAAALPGAESLDPGALLAFALNEGSGLGQALTPPEYYEGFWDLLAPASVALASGMTVLDTQNSALMLPAVTSDPAAAWTPEGAPIPLSNDPGGRYVTAVPRKLASLVVLSNEVVRDSSPAALGVIEFQLARSLALGLDKAVFQGSGTAPEIRGLRNLSGAQTVDVGTNGAALTNLDPFAQALGLLDAANATGPRAIVMHPSVWQVLSKIKERTDSVRPLMTVATAPTAAAERSIYGVPVYLTSQLDTTEAHGTSNSTSSAWVYDASQVIVVRRLALGANGTTTPALVEVDQSVLFNSDQAVIRGVLRADVAVPNPQAVVRIEGITT